MNSSCETLCPVFQECQRRINLIDAMREESFRDIANTPFDTSSLEPATASIDIAYNLDKDPYKYLYEEATAGEFEVIIAQETCNGPRPKISAWLRIAIARINDYYGSFALEPTDYYRVRQQIISEHSSCTSKLAHIGLMKIAVIQPRKAA